MVAASEVSLRAVLPSDLPIFFEQQTDPDAIRMADFPPRERDAFMAHWEKILRDETSVIRTIVSNGQVAGNVLCFMQYGRRHVGYWLGKAYWGRGVATKALALLLRDVDERPLFAHVALHNVASRRVLEKCGFKIYEEPEAAHPAAGEAIEEFVLRLDAGDGA